MAAASSSSASAGGGGFRRSAQCVLRQIRLRYWLRRDVVAAANLPAKCTTRRPQLELTCMRSLPSSRCLSLTLSCRLAVKVTLTRVCLALSYCLPACWGSPAFRCVHCTFDCSLALLMVLVLLCCCCCCFCYCAALAVSYFSVSFSMRFDSKLLIAAAFRTHAHTLFTHSHAHSRPASRGEHAQLTLCLTSFTMALARILRNFVISFAAAATNFFDKQGLISKLCISLFCWFFLRIALSVTLMSFNFAYLCLISDFGSIR